MVVKMTFSLDEATAERLRQASQTLRKPKSEIVRDAIQDYSERIGKLSEAERRRLLRLFDEFVPALPERTQTEVDEEIRLVREARRGGGRLSGSDGKK